MRCSKEQNSRMWMAYYYNQPLSSFSSGEGVRKENIDQMGGMYAIETVQSKLASMIVSVLEENFPFRFFVDYSILNVVKTRIWCPVMRMDKCFDFLGNAMVFSTLEANIVYRYIEIAGDDSKKIKNTFLHGLFSVNIMLFELKSPWEALTRYGSPTPQY